MEYLIRAVVFPGVTPRRGRGSAHATPHQLALAAAASATLLLQAAEEVEEVSDTVVTSGEARAAEAAAAVTVLPPPSRRRHLRRGVADAMDVTPVETKVEVEAPAAVEQAAAEAALSSAGTLRSPPPPLAAPSQLTPSLTPLSSPVALPPPSPSMETAAQSLQWIRQAAPSVRTVQPSAAKPRRQTVSISRYWSPCAACKRMRNVPKSVHDEVRI
jgi:hypothetical protein